MTSFLLTSCNGCVMRLKNSWIARDRMQEKSFARKLVHGGWQILSIKIRYLMFVTRTRKCLQLPIMSSGGNLNSIRSTAGMLCQVKGISPFIQIGGRGNKTSRSTSSIPSGYWTTLPLKMELPGWCREHISWPDRHVIMSLIYGDLIQTKS